MHLGDRKKIHDPSGNRCFDLREVPSEERGDGGDGEGLVEARHWTRQIEKEGQALGGEDAFEPTPVQRAQLAELGYAEWCDRSCRLYARANDLHR